MDVMVNGILNLSQKANQTKKRKHNKFIAVLSVSEHSQKSRDNRHLIRVQTAWRRKEWRAVEIAESAHCICCPFAHFTGAPPLSMK